MVAASPLMEELRHLPTDRLEEAAAFIQALVADRREKRNVMLDATAGSLSETQGQALEAALAECEHIDESGW